jgi:FixJ family two-component response regulator
LVDRGIHASVVVSARLADERLWSEVLWRGAYDVIVEPYEAEEVRRIVEGALRAASTVPNARATASTSMN